MNTNEILESIYKAYGSDSGVLLGITDKQVVKAIVEFTINRLPAPDSGEWKKMYEALNNEMEYWKKRCEAAEENIRTYSEWSEMAMNPDCTDDSLP